MNIKISKNKEFDQFNLLAGEWWNPEGKFKILHKILPIRMKYITENINYNKLKKMKILDLGCGGGLTCESLARLGTNVTGIDFIKKNIEIATKHAKISKLKINYIVDDLDSIKIKDKYDLILVLEVLEHLENWEALIIKIKNNLKPNGKIIISTINQTQLANIFGIFFAENILKWIPKNTHNYKKFIKPTNLKKILKKNNFVIQDISGMNFNPFLGQWNLSKKKYPINYFCTASLN